MIGVLDKDFVHLFVCIIQKTHDNIYSFQIGQATIKCDGIATLLGFNIDCMPKLMRMFWHSAKISCQTVSSLDRFITRQGHLKLVNYNSFMASNLCLHNHYHCRKKDGKNMLQLNDATCLSLEDFPASRLKSRLVPLAEWQSIRFNFALSVYTHAYCQ